MNYTHINGDVAFINSDIKSELDIPYWYNRINKQIFDLKEAIKLWPTGEYQEALKVRKAKLAEYQIFAKELSDRLK